MLKNSQKILSLLICVALLSCVGTQSGKLENDTGGFTDDEVDAKLTLLPPVTSNSGETTFSAILKNTSKEFLCTTPNTEHALEVEISGAKNSFLLLDSGNAPVIIGPSNEKEGAFVASIYYNHAIAVKAGTETELNITLSPFNGAYFANTSNEYMANYQKGTPLNVSVSAVVFDCKFRNLVAAVEAKKFVRLKSNSLDFTANAKLFVK